MASFASSLTVAQYRALGYSPAPGPHPVAILDTGAAIAAMTLDEFEMLVWQGIAVLDASDGFLSLTVEQYVVNLNYGGAAGAQPIAPLNTPPGLGPTGIQPGGGALQGQGMIQPIPGVTP